MIYRTRFLAVSVLWVAAVTAVLVVGALTLRDRLPDPIASHWSFSGAPNDSMSVTGFLVFLLVGWLAVGVGALWNGARGWRLRRTRAATSAILAAAGVFVVGLGALTAWVNLDAVEWRQAGSLSWQVVPMLAAAGIAGRVGWFACNRGPDEEQDLASGSELALKAGERAVWLSSMSSQVLRVGGVVVLLVSVVTFIFQTWQVALAPLLAGAACLAISSARVQVDERGVRVAFGPQRWPARRIRLAQIEGARVETRRALEVGGWGYRVLPSSTAIMMRSGECLVLRLTSGRDFYISVDHAERGAELVNALITESSAL
ncbi:DUF1648 domain-containing protein [Saccharopolyspora pogona]|uniref:DUF1648 domain-containing protein n=1 Tax=Saccharopolyspora pogona TaxID=333966 RepID=UPI00168950B3|nr:DUF1648 domain-containing protein [Saccharopolyspora pogona]